MSAAAACKGGGADAPAVEPGKTVGKVLEVTGKVTATRGTETRDLDASSSVSGDDVISTSGDGRVTILLAHNNAKWDLGPNKKEQVSTSMAWQLAKVDAPAGKVDETTTAAGRHAERAAANGESAAAPSTERAVAPGGPPPAEAPVAPTTPPAPRAAVAIPATGGAQPSRGGGSKGGPPSDKRSSPATEPARKVAKESPPPPPPAPPPGPLGGANDALDGAAAAPKIESAKAPESTRAADGGANPLAAAVNKELTALKACVVASGKDKLAMRVHFAGGQTTITLADGSAADKACVAKVAQRIKLTADADYTTVITK